MAVRQFGRRWIIGLVVFSLLITGSVVVATHAARVSAQSSIPGFSFMLNGTEYLAGCEGGAAITKRLSDAAGNKGDFDQVNIGTWPTYYVDSRGVKHFYGDFTGTEIVGKSGPWVVDDVDFDVPGIGKVQHNDHVLSPWLPAVAPASLHDVGYIDGPVTYTPETLMGGREAFEDITVFDGRRNYVEYAQTIEAHLGNYDIPGSPSQYPEYQCIKATLDGQCEYSDSGKFELAREGIVHSLFGDEGLRIFESNFLHSASASQTLNTTSLAALAHPSLPPLAPLLAIASPVFFITSIMTTAFCGFILASCSRNAQRITAGIGFFFGLLAGLTGGIGAILTSLKVFAQTANTAVTASVGGEVIHEALGGIIAQEESGVAATAILSPTTSTSAVQIELQDLSQLKEQLSDFQAAILSV